MEGRIQVHHNYISTISNHENKKDLINRLKRSNPHNIPAYEAEMTCHMIMHDDVLGRILTILKQDDYYRTLEELPVIKHTISTHTTTVGCTSHCAGDHQSRDCPMRQQHQANTTSNPASGSGIYQNTKHLQTLHLFHSKANPLLASQLLHSQSLTHHFSIISNIHCQLTHN